MKIKAISSKVGTISLHRTAKPVERERGAEWRRQRDAVMLIDKGLCRQCRRDGRVVAAADVDHIIPLSMGGPDTVANKQALCVQCHQKKTKSEIYGAIESKVKL